jgi:CCR4-NOT transcriptional regulation complex NOT5 subunit
VSAAGWCQRIKSEFKFEYAYLEDELGGVEA